MMDQPRGDHPTKRAGAIRTTRWIVRSLRRVGHHIVRGMAHSALKMLDIAWVTPTNHHAPRFRTLRRSCFPRFFTKSTGFAGRGRPSKLVFRGFVKYNNSQPLIRYSAGATMAVAFARITNHGTPWGNAVPQRTGACPTQSSHVRITARWGARQGTTTTASARLRITDIALIVLPQSGPRGTLSWARHCVGSPGHAITAPGRDQAPPS
jgi:hypothetical protein